MPYKKHLFERPPPAPVFRPTLKEFEDPLDYIEKIRPVAQKFGICKIISPKQWNPPFAVDSHTFKFRPRVQRLNEIGAHSRMRNNFMRTLEAFWDCQNLPLTIPVIKNTPVDLFELHNKVKRYGGCHQVTKNKQWTHICRELGYGEKSKQLCSTIRSYFEKLIQPYLDFYDNIFIDKNSELFPAHRVQQGSKSKTGITLDTPKMTRSKTIVITTSNDNGETEPPDRERCRGCRLPSDRHDPTTLACFECDEQFHLSCTDPPLSDMPRSGWVCSRCTQASCQQELARLHAEVFGFSQSTCKYSLESFSNYADNFKKTYFQNRKTVSLKEVEDEYWRLVAADDATDDVVVKYGADISSGLTSSGFPTRRNQHTLSEQDLKYVDSGWNLNNLPVLKKSIFKFVTNDISGMTVPWCYVGMVFSCFCWHIEDHWSYSINYLHTGECKTWYGVPESDADNFETLMRSEASELFDKSPDLLHHITTQINPALLMKHDVKVYRTDQAAGEFVVTFPRAYHAGFNQGFNFAEAVNFCPADWLSKGRASVESYRLVKRPSVFSHNELICKMASSLEMLDLLLLKAVHEELLVIQTNEKAHRKQICALASASHGPCRTERLLLDQMPEDDRECLVCRTTLYMSGVTCTTCCRDQNTDRMVCLDHLNVMCQCDPDVQNIVLKYRYSLDEISALVNNVHKQLEQYWLWMSRVYHLAKSEFCSSPVTDEEGRVMKNVSAFIENLDILREGFSGKNVEEKPNLEELKMLLKIGRSMNIPVYLLDFLEAIIDTCQRAMSMTDELLSTHRATMKVESKENKENESTAAHSPTKSKKTSEAATLKVEPSHEQQAEKLTLGEMRLLVEKLRSLPAHVPQLEEAAQTLHTINEWRMRVRQVVSGPDVVDEAILGSLIDSGESRLVYLSEYGMLHKMRHYTNWIGSAQQLIKVSEQSSSLPTLDQFKKVRDEGEGLVNMIEIDRIATMTEPLELEDDDDQVEEYDESTDFRMVGWNMIIEHLKKNEKQLTKTITEGEAMQKKADDILNSTPGVFALFSLNSLLKNADSELKCSVPGIDRLKEVVKEAVLVNEHINEMWQKLQQNNRLVHVDELQAIIKQADSLCVAFDRLADIKTLYRSIEIWRKSVHALFIKQCHNPYLATPTLLEVLFPRPQRQFKLMIAREAVSSKLVADCKIESASLSCTGDSSTHISVKDEPESGGDDEQKSKLTSPTRSSRTKRGRQKRANLASDDPQVARLDNVAIFEAFLRNNSSSTTGTATDLEFQSQYRNMCVNELEWMWNLRELNEDKASRDSSGHDFYCFCRKRGIDQKGAQVMCDLCQDWFHLSCLGLAHNQRDWSKRKFLCPQCERSRRPPFEVLLAEKRKLEQEARMVRVPEHAALCLMAQRVINFHKHTNQLFSPQTELGAAFAEYKRLFGVQAILPRYGTVATGPVSGSGHHDLHSSSIVAHGDCGIGNSAHVAAVSSSGKQSRKTPHSMAAKPSGPSVVGGSGMLSSAASLPATNMSMVATATQLSPVLAPPPSRETVVNVNRLKASLSEDARRELEEIYIELCLLEVSQPTVTWVWKLYHSLIDSAGDDCADLTDTVAGDNSGVGGGGDGTSTAAMGDDGASVHHSFNHRGNSDTDSCHHRNFPHVTVDIGGGGGGGTGGLAAHSLGGPMASDDDDDANNDAVHGSEDSRHQSSALDMEYMRPYLSSQSNQLSLARPAGRRGRLPQIAVDSTNIKDEKFHRESIHKFSFKRKLASKDTQQQQQHAGTGTAASQKKTGTSRQAISQHQPPSKANAPRKRGRGAGKVGSSSRGDSWERHKANSGSLGAGVAAALSSEYYDMENDVILLDKVVRAQEMKTARSVAATVAAVSKKSSGSRHSAASAAAAGLDGDTRHTTRRAATKYVSKLSLSDKSDYSDEVAPSYQSMEMKPVISTAALTKRGRKPGSSSTASVQKDSRVDISSAASHNISPKRRRRVPVQNSGKSSHGGTGSKRICNDDCSADMCVQQSSEKVNWVACDICDKWFHWLCVDIKSEMEIEQRFLCPRCKSVKRQKRAAPTEFRRGHECHSSHSADKRLSSLTGDEDELDGDDDLNVTLDDEVGPSTTAEAGASQHHQDHPVVKGGGGGGGGGGLPGLVGRQQQQFQQHSTTSNAFSINLSPPSMYLQSDCYVQEEVVEISYASRSDSDS